MDVKQKYILVNIARTDQVQKQKFYGQTIELKLKRYYFVSTDLQEVEILAATPDAAWEYLEDREKEKQV